MTVETQGGAPPGMRCGRWIVLALAVIMALLAGWLVFAIRTSLEPPVDFTKQVYLRADARFCDSAVHFLLARRDAAGCARTPTPVGVSVIEYNGVVWAARLRRQGGDPAPIWASLGDLTNGG